MQVGKQGTYLRQGKPIGASDFLQVVMLIFVAGYAKAGGCFAADRTAIAGEPLILPACPGQ